MSIVIGDGSTSPFAQQGTIDWVQLGNTGVTDSHGQHFIKDISSAC